MSKYEICTKVVFYGGLVNKLTFKITLREFRRDILNTKLFLTKALSKNPIQTTTYTQLSASLYFPSIKMNTSMKKRGFFPLFLSSVTTHHTVCQLKLIKIPFTMYTFIYLWKKLFIFPLIMVNIWLQVWAAP